MSKYHTISEVTLTLDALNDIILNHKSIKLSTELEAKITDCRNYLDNKIKGNKNPLYGINTGFGALYNVKISSKNLKKLQENLILSHACGTGQVVPKDIVKLMLLLKIKSLSFGKSGVQLETVKRLVDFYNNNILPVVYTQGSLGASGDLAPLAHLSLPLIGKGLVWYKGDIVNTEEIYKKFNWKPIQLQSKEGLALLNGTQFMGAYGVYVLLKSLKLSYLADVIGAMSLDAYDGRIEPFNELVHFARPHNGQIKTSERIREFLSGSELINQKKAHVQDPYSFR